MQQHIALRGWVRYIKGYVTVCFFMWWWLKICQHNILLALIINDIQHFSCGRIQSTLWVSRFSTHAHWTWNVGQPSEKPFFKKFETYLNYGTPKQVEFHFEDCQLDWPFWLPCSPLRFEKGTRQGFFVSYNPDINEGLLVRTGVGDTDTDTSSLGYPTRSA